MSANELTLTAATTLALHTPLVDILDCTYPVLCAGMGGVARAALASAVSEAGGFGCMGMVRESPQFIRQQIEHYRTISQKPFAVNIIPAATDRELLTQQVDVLIDMSVPAVCLFWDVVPEIVRRFTDAGITVMHQVGDVKDADAALVAGSDILIVQGVDAGGHVRGTRSIYTLLPEICHISPVPVVAAGGIATGQAIAAAMLLGAQGVCCGSAFLATTESNAHDYHKQRLVNATADDTIHTQVFHLNWPLSAPVRVLRSSITEAGSPDKLHSSDKVKIGEQDGQPVFLYSTDSPLQGATGELQKMALYAGRSCSDINNLCSAADRVQQLVRETTLALQQLQATDSPTTTLQPVSEVSSSPCMVNEFSGDYAGHCDDEELDELLQQLLATERTAAKVCALSLRQAGRGKQYGLLLGIHRDRVKSCATLLQCMDLLGKTPGGAMDNSIDVCMGIADIGDRLQYLERGKARAVHLISGVLPRIGQADIFNLLNSMRDEYQSNNAKTGIV